MDAFKNEGAAIRKREETHKMAKPTAPSRITACN